MYLFELGGVEFSTSVLSTVRARGDFVQIHLPLGQETHYVDWIVYFLVSTEL